MSDKTLDPFVLLTSAAVEGMLRQLSRLSVPDAAVSSMVVLVQTQSGVYSAGYGCFCPGCDQELREALGRLVRAQREGIPAGEGALH